MEKEELFDKAEEYFKDQLSKEERLAFEKELAKNDATIEEVRLYSRIIDANSQNEVANLKATMKDILQEQRREPKVLETTKGNYNTLIIIGLLLLAVVIVIMVSINASGSGSIEEQEDIEQPIAAKKQPPNESSDQLREEIPPVQENEPSDFSQKTDSKNNIEAPSNTKAEEYKIESQAIAMAYYEVPASIFPGNNEMRSENNLSVIEQARIAFKEGLDTKESNKEQSDGNFQECVELLNSLIEKKQNTKAIFYRAHAQFQLARYNEAALDFETASQSRRLKEQAQWGLVLARLSVGGQYQELLEEIKSNPGHTFHDKALALEDSLR
jgi:tetratricopeptide (TPR) repeat protein